MLAHGTVLPIARVKSDSTRAVHDSYQLHVVAHGHVVSFGFHWTSTSTSHRPFFTLDSASGGLINIMGLIAIPGSGTRYHRLYLVSTSQHPN